MLAHDTIIAQCTPAGVGALSLIRLTGYDAIVIADRMVKLSSGKALVTLATHTIHHGAIIDQRTHTIDQVLILLMRAPKTFTGEDTIEFTCHGNPFIVQEIINLAIHHGARLAQPGEFTQRAVANGKLDVLRAEAIHELVNAQSHQALKYSLAQLQGSLSHHIASFEEELLKALALSEASFEFIDEDEEFGHQIRHIIDNVQHQIKTLLQSFSHKKILKEGVRIALIGSVNTGKSSLFNTLIGTQRSIVTDRAGTTRDTVESTIECEGVFVTLVDTAGLRQTDDIIEQEGIARSYDQAHTADIILLIFDGTRILTPQEVAVYSRIEQEYDAKIINVVTKTDLPQCRVQSNDTIEVSSHTKMGIDVLKDSIARKVKNLVAQTSASPYMLTQRHYALLTTLDQELTSISSMLLQKHAPYELISHHLKEAITHLNALTGKSISEQSMDLIFRQFCIGK